MTVLVLVLVLGLVLGLGLVYGSGCEGQGSKWYLKIQMSGIKSKKSAVTTVVRREKL